MRNDLRKQYKYIPNRFGREYHEWSIESEFGACHLHISYRESDPQTSGGIEVHYRKPPEYMKGSAPHYHNCPLTGGLCWHDGSSMAADIAIEAFRDGKNVSREHDYYFGIVLDWMKSRGLVHDIDEEE